MKIKTVYIYVGTFILFIAIIVLFSSNKEGSAVPGQQTAEMPNDEVHKDLQPPGSEAPSKSNVKQDAVAKMKALEEEVEKNPNDTSAAKQYADMLAVGHQPDKAIELYEGILKKNPKRIDIMLQLTYVYFNKGDLDMAENYTNRILEIDKSNQYASYNIGAIAAARGNTDKAKNIWFEVSKKFPGTEVGDMAKHAIMQLEQTAKNK